MLSLVTCTMPLCSQIFSAFHGLAVKNVYVPIVFFPFATNLVTSSVSQIMDDYNIMVHFKIVIHIGHSQR